MIERALLSAFDKEGLAEFAAGLAELGVEIVASGGTADHLAEHGLEVTRVEELTEIPELLGGRVKTLHPRIHAAILARRDHPDDLAALDEHDIQPFDLVCVTLYPFTQVVSRQGVKEEDAVEMIDIGGPSMLRGAAKNFAHVAPVCRPERYGSILAELRETGEISLETRRALAAEAFALTAAYEAAIARWFADRDAFPELFIPSFEKVTDLAYGENPHQRAAYYAELGARRHLLSRVQQLHGRQLSFINLYDLNAGRILLREFELPACVIVKHANPCGVAVAASIEEAYDRALAADPMSAFGMVCVLNRPSAPSSAGRSRTSSSTCCSRPTTTRPRSTRCARSRTRGSSSTASGAASTWARRTTSASTAGCSSRIATGTCRTARRWRSSRGRSRRTSGATCSSRGACART